MQPLEMAQEFVAYSKNKSKGLSKTLLAAGAVLVLVIFALSGQSPGSASSAHTFQPGPPIAALAPPGECAFGEDWAPAPLIERRKVSDDAVLLRELRSAFLESAAKQLDLLKRARCDGNWHVAAMRLKGLAASFHAEDLLQAAEIALHAAPGEPMAIREVEAVIARFARTRTPDPNRI